MTLVVFVVVVKFKYGVLRGVEYAHSEWSINICFISISKQQIS